MKAVNLSIIVIIVFCSFSVMLYPRDLYNENTQDETYNTTNNKNKQDFQDDISNRLWFKITIVVLGFIFGIFSNIYIIRYKEHRSVKNEFGKVFEDFYWEINNSELSIQGIIANIVYPKIPFTNKTVGVFLPKIWCSRKRKKIRTVYENYKNGNYVFRGQPQDKLLETYYFNETKMIETFGKQDEIKTGKDLLLHNLQQIIDLAK